MANESTAKVFSPKSGRSALTVLLLLYVIIIVDNFADYVRTDGVDDFVFSIVLILILILMVAHYLRLRYELTPNDFVVRRLGPPFRIPLRSITHIGPKRAAPFWTLGLRRTTLSGYRYFGSAGDLEIEYRKEDERSWILLINPQQPQTLEADLRAAVLNAGGHASGPEA